MRSFVSFDSVAFVVVLIAVVMAPIGMVSDVHAQANTTHVVDNDGSGDFTSIQTAVDNANQNDRIEIRPGTYSESVDVNKDVDIVAPDGATIAPSSNAVSAVAIEDGAEPRIVNLSIEGKNRIGIDARSATGNWTLKNVEITEFDFGIAAHRSTGDWVVDDTTIKNIDSRGISTDASGGDWTIRSSVIRNVSGIGIDAYRINAGVIRDTVITNISQKEGANGDGILLHDTSGDWKIANVTIRDVEAAGIDATETNSTYAPVIQNTTIDGTSTEGIDIANSKGKVTITGTTVRNTGDNGIRIEESLADWTIRNTTLNNISGEGIDAYNQPESSQATIRNLTVTDTQNHGVNFYSSDGDWEIIDSYIANSGRKGVEAGDTTGTWSITTTTVEGTDEVLIEASGAAGHWEIHESNLQTGGEALNATEATRGNASHNYWGSGDGPSGAFSGSGGAVVGNLTVKPYYIDIGLTTLNTDNNPDSGISVANDLQGNGTEADPYVVQNITGLQVIETDLAANYTLGTDINASPLADGKGFDPIGNESAPFTGRFDGQDHTIRGLSINRPGTDNIGLFGFIEGAVVQDVTLRNVNITGGRRTGGLIGWNIGTVRNVSVAGQVNGTYNVGGVAGQNSELVIQASASGRVNGIEAVGGLVGLNFELRSTIKESYATARVNGSQDVGGLVGVNVAFTVIKQAYSTGQVTGTEAVGGLVGRNDRGADISYTYAAGQVNGSTAVGGLVGRTGGGATVTSSYWDINTSGQSSSADNATSLTTAEMIGNTAEQNMAGFEFGSMWRTIIGDYPRLAFSKDATALPPVVGNNQPTDPDGDGKYDDITGDGTTNILDVGALLKNRNSPAIQNNPDKFDFTGDGRVNILDVGKLLQQVL